MPRQAFTSFGQQCDNVDAYSWAFQCLPRHSPLSDGPWSARCVAQLVEVSMPASAFTSFGPVATLKLVNLYGCVSMPASAFTSFGHLNVAPYRDLAPPARFNACLGIHLFRTVRRQLGA